ncbi:MAG: hypothetical protein H7263_01135 [Candidatus Sericytochromatia bacterium]|nr:hypothetical protein [Candidatus Sericytochromatia bacterium]
MPELIENAKLISEAAYNKKSTISDDIKEIIRYAALHPKEGIVVEIPWEAKVNNLNYMKSIVVVITKVTKQKVYYENPVKISEEPKIPRIIENDGTESILLVDLLKIANIRPIYGIIIEDLEPSDV